MLCDVDEELCRIELHRKEFGPSVNPYTSQTLPSEAAAHGALSEELHALPASTLAGAPAFL